MPNTASYQENITIVKSFCSTKEDWQNLPYQVQFFPCFAKYRKEIPLINYLNPLLPNGGFTEYPKHLLHHKIPHEYFPKSVDFLHQDIPSLHLIKQSCKAYGIDFPLMIKADVGERGQGIAYIPDEDALDSYYTTHEENLHTFTIQKYCNDPKEYCVQFYKNNEDSFEIHSVAERHIPSIIGDGKQTVEHLILEHETLTDTQKEKIITDIKSTEPNLLVSIPKDGELVQIVRKASIEYGTKYKKIMGNLEATLTKGRGKEDMQLRQKLEDIINNHVLKNVHENMDIGRFDLKTASFEDLLEGKFTVIECNGAGAIPCHIYDEDISIDQKYAELDAHFQWMFRIVKDSNKQNGLYTQLMFYMSCFKSMKKKGFSLTNIFSPKTRRTVSYLFRIAQKSFTHKE